MTHYNRVGIVLATLGALGLSTLGAGCHAPSYPSLKAGTYKVVSLRIEEGHNYTVTRYDEICLARDTSGACTNSVEIPRQETYWDDTDYVVTVEQCWPKDGKPVWNQQKTRIIRVIPNDEQTCRLRDVYTYEDIYKSTKGEAVVRLDRRWSTSDSDIRT